MFIETETTPNPMSLKCLPGQQVMAAGTREFTSPEAAAASPLAQAIFDTGEVSNVMFGRDFVSVTAARSEEHTSELQSLMRISYAVFCLKKKNNENNSIKHAII